MPRPLDCSLYTSLPHGQHPAPNPSPYRGGESGGGESGGKILGYESCLYNNKGNTGATGATLMVTGLTCNKLLVAPGMPMVLLWCYWLKTDFVSCNMGMLHETKFMGSLLFHKRWLLFRKRCLLAEKSERLLEKSERLLEKSAPLLTPYS